MKNFCKVLIVDDEKIVRQGFIHMDNWQEKGFIIIGEASNGTEALKIIEDSKPDIVVSDIRMPVMDGIELTGIIKKRYPYMEVIIISSYNDFDYVKETLKLGAMDYLLKAKMEIKDLLEIMNKAKLRIEQKNEFKTGTNIYDKYTMKETFLNNIVCNRTYTAEYIEKNLGNFNINLKSENIIIIVYALDGISKADLDKNELDLLLNNIIAAMDKIYYGFSFFNSDGYFISIINISPEREILLPQMLKETIDYANNTLKFRINIGVSCKFNGYETIPDKFEEALKVLEFKFYKGPNCIIFPYESNNRQYLPEINYKGLSMFLDKHDFKNLEASVKDIFISGISKNSFIEPYALKKAYEGIIHFIIQKNYEMGFNTEELNIKKIYYFKKIENACYFSDLLLYGSEIINDIAVSIKNSTGMKYNQMKYNLPVINQVIDYVIKNYDKDVSLSAIAAHIHHNSCYLSQLFKRETNMNFNEFVTNLRMDAAKKMLKDPLNNMDKVCESIGYHDQSYFGKVFKKVVGMCPSEFHNIYSKKDKNFTTKN